MLLLSHKDLNCKMQKLHRPYFFYHSTENLELNVKRLTGKNFQPYRNFKILLKRKT